MAKATPQVKLVNGEIADADVVNQIVENVGSQGGLIPYDPTTNNQETNGSQSIGSTAFPWGSLFVNRLANFVEVDPSTNTAASTIAINLLRKFISMKDAPGNGTGSYTGNGGRFLQVNVGETGLQFAIPTNIQSFTSSGTFVAPAGITTIYITMIGGGGQGGQGGTSGRGGGGAPGVCYIKRGYTVVPGNSYTVTIGAANGGTTVFDGLSAAGGATGSAGSGASNGAGGLANVGIGINLGSGVTGGAGAGTSFGDGGTVNGGNAGANTGAGGGGGAASAGTGGNGGSGLVEIEY